MTKVVIVGDIFYSELGVGGGPIIPPGPPPGVWPGPAPGHPWVPPQGGPPPGVWPGPGPSHPIVIPGVPPGQPGSPQHPIYVPIYPDQGLPPGSPGYPSHPIQGVGPGPGHPWVPPEGETLPPPPADIADNTVVAVWQPPTQTWTVTVYEAKPV